MAVTQESGEGTAAPHAWPLVAVLGLLTVLLLLNNVIASGGYVLWAVLGMIGLALLARADGLRPPQWGLGPVTRRAAVAAIVLAGLMAAVMLLGTRLPGISGAYLDERATELSAGQVAFAALVRAPIGTALLEEVAFRGVLLAMLAKRFGLVWAVVGSSVAFGAWHALPALGLAADNAVVGSLIGGHPGWTIAAAVVTSGLGGAVFCALRIHYDHLIVPIAVHTTAVSLGYLLAWQMTGG